MINPPNISSLAIGVKLNMFKKNIKKGNIDSIR